MAHTTPDPFLHRQTPISNLLFLLNSGIQLNFTIIKDRPGRLERPNRLDRSNHHLCQHRKIHRFKRTRSEYFINTTKRTPIRHVHLNGNHSKDYFQTKSCIILSQNNLHIPSHKNHMGLWPGFRASESSSLFILATAYANIRLKILLWFMTYLLGFNTEKLPKCWIRWLTRPLTIVNCTWILSRIALLFYSLVAFRLSISAYFTRLLYRLSKFACLLLLSVIYTLSPAYHFSTAHELATLNHNKASTLHVSISSALQNDKIYSLKNHQFSLHHSRTTSGNSHAANTAINEESVKYSHDIAPQFNRPPATRKFKCFSSLMKNAGYKMDIWIESNEYSYFVILGAITMSWVVFCGCIVYLFNKPINKNYLFRDAIWKAWSCVASSSTHTKEDVSRMRYLTLLITLGGLLSYSLLTGTISATVKERMERVRRGDIIQMHPILEKNHVVILGYNPHVLPLLHQLNDARSFARRDHTAKDRLKVVLIYDPNLSGADVNTIPRKEFQNLRILMRRGSLNNPSLMSLVAAEKASQIIVFPSSNLSDNKSDSEVVASLLALKSLNITLANVVAECSKASTTKVVKTLCKDSATKVVTINQDIAPLLTVQFSQNASLYRVYKELLSHTGTIFNVRYFPELVGLTYGQVYNNFDESIVIGILRDTVTICGPSENEILRSSDRLILLSGKRLHLKLPPGFLERVKKRHSRKTILPVRLSSLSKFKNNTQAPIKVLENHYVKTNEQQAKSKPTWLLHAGWTGAGSAKFLIEYDKRATPGSTVVVLSIDPIVERERLISKYFSRETTVIDPLTSNHKVYPKNFENINVIHVFGNSMSQTDIFTALKLLKNFAPFREAKAKIRALVVDERKRVENTKPEDTILACDNYKVMTSLMLQESFAQKNIQAEVSCNIRDGRIVKQHAAAVPNINFFSTSEIMGLFTAQVAEHEYLSKVYGNLLGKGYEITFKKTEDFLRHHDATDANGKRNGMIDFETISHIAREKAQIPIGILTAQQEVLLNPYPREQSMIGPDDQLIVIGRDELCRRIFNH